MNSWIIRSLNLLLEGASLDLRPVGMWTLFRSQICPTAASGFLGGLEFLIRGVGVISYPSLCNKLHHKTQWLQRRLTISRCPVGWQTAARPHPAGLTPAAPFSAARWFQRESPQLSAGVPDPLASVDRPASVHGGPLGSPPRSPPGGSQLRSAVVRGQRSQSRLSMKQQVSGGAASEPAQPPLLPHSMVQRNHMAKGGEIDTPLGAGGTSPAAEAPGHQDGGTCGGRLCKQAATSVLFIVDSQVCALAQAWGHRVGTQRQGLSLA